MRPLRPVQESEEEASEEEQRPIVQFYRPEPKQDNAARVVYINDDEYNSLYGQNQQQTVTPKSRADTFRPATARASGTPSPQPRSKDSGTKAPVVQTIRNFNKVNDDGSFTFGYEAADGSFKEETRGTDCVVRGKYG